MIYIELYIELQSINYLYICEQACWQIIYLINMEQSLFWHEWRIGSCCFQLQLTGLTSTSQKKTLNNLIHMLANVVNHSSYSESKNGSPIHWQSLIIFSGANIGLEEAISATQ